MTDSNAFTPKDSLSHKQSGEDCSLPDSLPESTSIEEFLARLRIPTKTLDFLLHPYSGDFLAFLRVISSRRCMGAEKGAQHAQSK